MHLAKRGLDAHIGGSKIGVGGHDTDDTAGGRVKTGGNDTKNNILAGEDTGDGSLILHQKSSGVVLLHQSCRILHSGPDGDGHWGHTIQDRLESRAGHLLSQSLDILDNLLGLTGAKLGLHTLQSIVKFPR